MSAHEMRRMAGAATTAAGDVPAARSMSTADARTMSATAADVRTMSSHMTAATATTAAVAAATAAVAAGESVRRDRQTAKRKDGSKHES